MKRRFTRERVLIGIAVILAAIAIWQRWYVPRSERQAALDHRFYLAVEAGELERAEQLLAEGANIETMTRNTCPPLLVAAYSSRPDMVQMLLDNGADVNAADGLAWSGQTPLIRAAVVGRTENVRILLANGAEVDKENNEGATALTCAARGWIWGVWRPADTTDTVRLLPENGADPNHVDKSGIAPLLHALDTRKAEVVALLLENGADPTIGVPVQQTLLARAELGGDTNIARILREHAARTNSPSL